jgi:hypothetical protein
MLLTFALLPSISQNTISHNPLLAMKSSAIKLSTPIFFQHWKRLTFSPYSISIDHILQSIKYRILQEAFYFLRSRAEKLQHERFLASLRLTRAPLPTYTPPPPPSPLPFTEPVSSNPPPRDKRRKAALDTRFVPSCHCV